MSKGLGALKNPPLKGNIPILKWADAAKEYKFKHPNINVNYYGDIDWILSFV